ncbi:hypothetical protein D018_5071A, partial [Vibrio parahaemolyticus VP2007-007]
MEFFKVR